VKIVLWEGEESQDLKAVLDLTPPTHEFVGVVGPEGGFEREEVDRAKEAGFVSASLGRRTLRAETAAITLVGVVQYQWGDLALRR
jgi:16S rRNA (uracil1498-N3)-methyltransferase